MTDRFALGRRALFVGATGAYVAVFWVSYAQFTAERFDYLGLGYDPRWPWHDVSFFWLFALVPALILPLDGRRISDFFVLLQYFVIYIPALLLVQHSTLPSLADETWVVLSFAMLVGLCVMIGMRRALPLLAVPRLDLSAPAFWILVVLATLVLQVYLTWLFQGSFQLVRLEEIYSVREQATAVIEDSGSRFGGYAYVWLNAVCLPLLFAVAVTKRSALLLGVVVGGYVFLFGIWGGKMSLLAPIYLTAFYFLSKRNPHSIAALFALGLIFLLSVPYLLPENGVLGLAREAWVNIVHMRTFGIPALLMAQYADFFATQPLTLGSHVTGLNLLFDYPYDLDVPRTVGFHYYGELVTSNVNLWAQDGVASFGPVGIVFISMIAGAVLWLLDSITRGMSLTFLAPALGVIMLSFANVSLFTTLVTGGLLPMMILFTFMRPLSQTAPAPGELPDKHLRATAVRDAS